MASEVMLTVLCLCFLSPVAVTGYYCDSGKCNEDEYCCGSNICCTSYAVWQMWYFWCGIVFFVIMLSACAGFCRYRYSERTLIIQGPGPYSRLDNTSSSIHDIYTPSQGAIIYTDYTGKSHAKEHSDGRTYSPEYPPPAYKEKDPSFMR